jgi:uncharacterized protein YkwD
MKPKTTVMAIALAFASIVGQAQGLWKAEQLAAANTCDTISILQQEEKNAILYLNLARMFPKDFLKYEIYPRQSSIQTSYYNSLVKTMSAMKPVAPVRFDRVMYENALCFANEQGPTTRVGHNRFKCGASYLGECISYGQETGQDIALQLIIDEDVPSLGHRKMCLSPAYKKVGIKNGEHGLHGFMSVVDFE